MLRLSSRKKWIFALFFAVVVFVFGFLPPLVEMRMNSVAPGKLIPISDAARTMQQTVFVADLHADSLLFHRDLTVRGTRGHLDLPRMREGNVGLQVFSVVSKTPRGLNYDKNPADTDNITLVAMASLWPLRTWFSLRERALYQASRLAALAQDPKNRFVQIRSTNDLNGFFRRRMDDHETTAGLLSMEGAQPLEGKAENVQAMYDAGFRMIGLAHFFDNEIAGSAHGVRKDGLTTVGRQVVQELEARHMIVDLAHSSPKTIDEVLAIATRPVVVSHTGVKGTCNSVRNLSDTQLRAIAVNGGLIGIGFWDTATCGNDVRAIVRAIKYAVSIAGVEHIALGSDYDGTTTVPFDCSQMVQLTQALMDEGFTEVDIHKIMGANTIEFLRNNLPKT
jgi:membrane dipeptidase